MRVALAVVLWSVGAALAAEPAKVGKIDAKAAAQLVAQKAATIVDVREQDETAEGMARPAQWFATSRIEADPAAFKAFLATLPRGKVLFYCAAGYRAGQAAQKAAALGYEVANMGSYDGWVDAKLPIKKP